MGNQTKDRREQAWYIKAPAIIEPFIKEAKKSGYKVDDGVETIVLTRPDIGFKIMISRASSVLQCYYTGAGWDFTSNPLSDFITTTDIWDHVAECIQVLSTSPKDLRARGFGHDFYSDSDSDI